MLPALPHPIANAIEDEVAFVRDDSSASAESGPGTQLGVELDDHALFEGNGERDLVTLGESG